MAEVTLSSKNQIVIPREARERLGLKPGDKLLVVVQGDVLIVRPQPESFEHALRGIARGVYPPGYLEKERQSWDDPSS
jgi:AbrB family looped-hinge helix DNA binding protein